MRGSNCIKCQDFYAGLECLKCNPPKLKDKYNFDYSLFPNALYDLYIDAGLVPIIDNKPKINRLD